MAGVNHDTWLEARGQWLDENKANEADVLCDRGGEFVFVGWRKTYLPDNLQYGYESYD